MVNEELKHQKNQRIHEVHRVVPSRTALLVVDMQRSFMDPEASLAVPTSWDIVDPIQRLMDLCRRSDIPVVFTQFVAQPEIPNLRCDPFGPEHLPAEDDAPTGWGLPSNNSILGATGPESPEIIERLQPLPGEPVVPGFTLDKFYGSHLDLVLRGRDIRYLVVVGMMADLCLGATLFSASMREYRVTAVRDAITTIWPNVLDVMFDIFGRKLARVMDTGEIMEEITTELKAYTDT